MSLGTMFHICEMEAEMKFYLLVFVGLMAAFNASAEILYWQVSDLLVKDLPSDLPSSFKEAYSGNLHDDYAAGVYQEGFTYAWVRYGTGENYASYDVADNFKEGATGKDGRNVVGDELIIYEGDEYGNAGNFNLVDLDTITDAQNKSYYIEIWRYSNEKGWQGVARSETMTYGQLEAGHYIGAGGVLDPGTDFAIWQGSGYSIPEPTSAMLLMIGLSLVGLRRKRA